MVKCVKMQQSDWGGGFLDIVVGPKDLIIDFGCLENLWYLLSYCLLDRMKLASLRRCVRRVLEWTMVLWERLTENWVSMPGLVPGSSTKWTLVPSYLCVSCQSRLYSPFALEIWDCKGPSKILAPELLANVPHCLGMLTSGSHLYSLLYLKHLDFNVSRASS